MQDQVNNGTKTVYLAWFITSLFFFFQFMIRVLPNIISVDIFANFKIRAEEFSSLGSIYTITYGLVQIPIGFLLDRIDLKKLSLGAIILTLIGSILFALADTFYLLQIARFIIALGSGAALGITLKIISSNFSGISRSFLSGLTITLGVLGPIAGGEIITFLLSYHDWRFAILLLSGLGFLLFIIHFFFLPKNITHKTDTFKSNFLQISKVFTKPILVYAFIAAGLFVAPCVFADLWGAKFLMVRFNLPEVSAVSISLATYWGLALGSIILPYLAAVIKKSNLVIIISLFIILLGFLILLSYKNLSELELFWLIALIGFFCGAEMICFNAAWHLVPVNAAGLTVGVINSISLILNAFFQQIIGFILDKIWNGTLIDEVRVYSEDNYLIALSFVPLIIFLSLLFAFLHFHPKTR
jgi:MFS family permease